MENNTNHANNLLNPPWVTFKTPFNPLLKHKSPLLKRRTSSQAGLDTTPQRCPNAPSKAKMFSPRSLNIPIQNAVKSPTYEELQVRCEDFKNQLVKERLSRIQLEGDLATAQEEHEKEKRELEEDLDAFRAESGFTQDLRRRHKALEQEHTELLEKLQTFESQPKSFGTEPTQTSTETELRAKIANLEHELEVREPLYQVGRDIRLRFLELSKETVQYLNYHQIHHLTIEKGNAAAHGGNGLADASLLISEYLSKRRKTVLSKVYQDTYKHKHTERSSKPRLMLEARDCEATILTLKSLNGGLNRPLIERQRALDNIDIMEQKSKKLSREKFDSDPDMIRRLALVKEFTKQIVEYDRKSSGGVKKPDTSYGTSVSEEDVDNAEEMCNPKTWSRRTEKPAKSCPRA